jgi:hypothetical protein
MEHELFEPGRKQFFALIQCNNYVVVMPPATVPSFCLPQQKQGTYDANSTIIDGRVMGMMAGRQELQLKSGFIP